MMILNLTPQTNLSKIVLIGYSLIFIEDYLMSNNLINSFISFQYSDNGEVLEFYINFMKSLALQMRNYPVPLFLNEKFSSFPLLTQSIRFFDHKDSMIRTTVRNIVLSIFRSNFILIFLFQFSSNFYFFLFINFKKWFKKLYFC